MRLVMSGLLAATLMMVPVAGCKKEAPADAAATDGGATTSVDAGATNAPTEPAPAAAPAAAPATLDGGIAAFTEISVALKAAGTDCAKAASAMNEIGARNKAALDALRQAMKGDSPDGAAAMGKIIRPMEDMRPTMEACQADEGFQKAVALLDGRDPNAVPDAAAAPAVDNTPTGDAVIDAGLAGMAELAATLSANADDCDKAAAAVTPVVEKHRTAIQEFNKKMEGLPPEQQEAMVKRMMGTMAPMMQVAMKCQNHEGLNKAMASMNGEGEAAPGEPAAPAEPVAP